ncbi:DUF5684 domain-containing protein [Salinibacterium sp. ZJ454]|uniref:DUF5684 domain-containing protein n=1 Tax=Salinibacterium sp. ZJ454 TaxID=2708339 RepID=UPI001423CFDF|nr:DUF5684 domain-containing protein [Salinibacterium sp. ZJ454]
MSNDAIVVNAAALLGILLIAVAVWIGVYVWLAHALSKVFSKLGEEPWKAWVPFLNIAMLLRLGGYPWWWVFGNVIPVLNVPTLVVFYMAVHRVNGRFGKGGGFTVLAILLYPIWVSVLGYGAARPVDGARPVQEPPRVDSVRPVGSERLAGAAWPQAAATAAPTYAAPVAQPAAPAWLAAPVAPAVPVAVVAPLPVPASAHVPSLVEERAPASVSKPGPQPVTSATPPPPAANQWAPPITTVPGIPLREAVTVTPPTPTPPLNDAHLDTEATIITGAATSALDDEATRIVPRRTVWSLQTGAGQSITLTQDVVLLGRNPKPSFGPADAQLVKLEDPAKTVSQTHARLDRGPGGWSVTDLHSTNGVIVVGAEGAEREILPETSTELAERFQLGDLDLRLTTAR